MRLRDLKPNLLELPRQEGINLILAIRQSRHTPKRVEKEKKKQAEKKVRQTSLNIDNLEIEQLELLLKRVKERA